MSSDYYGSPGRLRKQSYSNDSEHISSINKEKDNEIIEKFKNKKYTDADLQELILIIEEYQNSLENAENEIILLNETIDHLEKCLDSPVKQPKCDIILERPTESLQEMDAQDNSGSQEQDILIGELQETIVQLDQELAETNRFLEKKEDEIDLLYRKVAILEKELNEKSFLTNNLINTNNSMETLDKEVKRLSQINRKLNITVSDQENEICQQNRVIAQLEADLENERAKCSKLENLIISSKIDLSSKESLKEAIERKGSRVLTSKDIDNMKNIKAETSSEENSSSISEQMNKLLLPKKWWGNSTGNGNLNANSSPSDNNWRKSTNSTFTRPKLTLSSSLASIGETKQKPQMSDAEIEGQRMIQDDQKKRFSRRRKTFAVVPMPQPLSKQTLRRYTMEEGSPTRKASSQKSFQQYPSSSDSDSDNDAKQQDVRIVGKNQIEAPSRRTRSYNEDDYKRGLDIADSNINVERSLFNIQLYEVDHGFENPYS